MRMALAIVFAIIWGATPIHAASNEKLRCITCAAGKTGENRYPQLSADGSALVFQSTAKLIISDKDKSSDIYLWETKTQGLKRLRTDDPGRRSGGPSISGDGSTVAFHVYPPKPSRLSAPTPSQVILWNVETSNYILVTKTPSGATHNGEALFPLLNNDGSWLLFSSNDSNLMPGKPAAFRSVYLYERKTGDISLMSRSSQGGWTNRSAGDPRMSDDARFIAFRSAATNICGELPENSLANHLYWMDRSDGLVIRVDEKERGLDPAEWAIGAYDMDARGQIIVFEARSKARKDPFDYLRSADLFIFNASEGKISPLLGDQFQQRARTPTISADGRFVAFVSKPKDGSQGSIVVYDREKNAYKRVGKEECLHPHISADGSTLAFECDELRNKQGGHQIYRVGNPLYGNN